MASANPTPLPLTRSRLRSLIWPREHGAWGLLLVPLVTGAGRSLAGDFAVASPERCGVEAHSLFQLCLRLRCRPGPGRPARLGSRLWTPAVGRGRGDRFSRSVRPEKTRPGNPPQRPVDGRHRAHLRASEPAGGAYVPHFGMYAALRDRSERIHARRRHVCATHEAMADVGPRLALAGAGPPRSERSASTSGLRPSYGAEGPDAGARRNLTAMVVTISIGSPFKSVGS